MNASGIYTQSINGTFRRVKNYGVCVLLLVYFGCSWLRWDRGVGLPNQAFLVDLPHRRAYFLSIEIWPDEIYYVTGMLILAAMGLFFVTALFGRIWCGYGCPHTVFVDLFRYVEHYFQGDRNQRIKLDMQPMTPEKFRKKLYTHLCWFAIGFSFAFGWVCYFYDAPSLGADLVRMNVNSTATIWLLGLSASTYLFAGYVRERVCMHMCPYGRFQSAMVDQNTYVVTYHNWRGEPRSNYNPSNSDLGDCIDCNKCVVVCPMGIDIRNGLQMACIGCGLCIDACNTVMPKLGREPNLIAYDSMVTTNTKRGAAKLSTCFFRIKVLMFAVIFSIVSGVMLYSIVHKNLYRTMVERERGPLFTITPDGSIRNTYTLKVLNRTHQQQNFKVSIVGLEHSLMLTPEMHEYQPTIDIQVAAGYELEQKIFIKVPADTNFASKQVPMVLRLTHADDLSQQVIEQHIMFATPDK